MLSRHRLLVAVCGALAALFFAHTALAVAAPAPTGIGWTVIDRYGGDPNGDGKLDGAGPLNPAALNVFAVRVLPTRAVCQELERAAWRVDGSPVRPVLEPGESCGAVVRVRGEGEHKVKVLARNRVEVARVTVDDELIVALGDSVASGEGNPEGRDHHWLERPCHRSAAAGFEQAARQLGEVDRRRSVTFVSLACSGARIDKGLLESYGGIAPEKGVEFAPQVERLQTIAEARAGRDGEGAGVDAVLLSVGANDVYFSKIVQFCALVSDCPHRHFDPQRPLMLGKASAPTLDAAIAERLRELARRYDRLDGEIASTIPRERIVISQYYDPTIGTGGAFCKVHMGPGTIDAHEAQWAHTRVLGALNAVVAQAARAHHWTLVDGVQEAFAGHGICAKHDQVWVRTLAQSYLWQDARLAFSSIAGTLHPNRSGHRAIGHLIEPKLARVLGTTVTPDPPDAPDAPDHRLLGIRATLLLWIGGVLVALGLVVAGVAVVRASVLASEAGNG
jgi:lysophospholipase L1-like esterase